jgi:hypothetical protein
VGAAAALIAVTFDTASKVLGIFPHPLAKTASGLAWALSRGVTMLGGAYFLNKTYATQ